MRTDELERILSSGKPIEPSAGFVGAVMAAVRSEAIAPLPLPFPWRRVVWGLVTVPFLLLTAWAVPPLGGPLATVGAVLGRAAAGLGASKTAWLTGTLFGSYLVVRFSQRLGPREA